MSRGDRGHVRVRRKGRLRPWVDPQLRQSLRAWAREAAAAGYEPARQWLAAKGLSP